MGRTVHRNGNHPFQGQGGLKAKAISLRLILCQLELQMGKLGSSEGCRLHQILSFASACADNVQASTFVKGNDLN